MTCRPLAVDLLTSFAISQAFDILTARLVSGPSSPPFAKNYFNVSPVIQMLRYATHVCIEYIYLP
jgi:hypothetical protein